MNRGTKKQNTFLHSVLLPAASFAGFNIGSTFITGIEAMQYFNSYGPTFGLIGICFSLILGSLVISLIFWTGYKQKFSDLSQVYTYLVGKKMGKVLDYYVYCSLTLTTLMMTCGASATVTQFFDLPTWIAGIIFAMLCFGTALLGFQKVRNILSNVSAVCIFMIIFCAIYIFIVSDTNIFDGGQNFQRYVDEGYILQANLWGIQNPIIASIGVVVCVANSGISWGTMNKARPQVKNSIFPAGALASLMYFGTNIFVVLIQFIALDSIYSKQIPMLAVVQKYLPGLSIVYMIVIILAIYSIVSGRMFMISERFSKNKLSRKLIVLSIIALAAMICAAFVSFTNIAYITFTINSAVGLIIVIALAFHFIKLKFVR